MNQSRSQSRATTLALAGLWLLATPLSATDWPQFRGPERDGISTETGLVRGWGEEGPVELWRRPSGAGFSTITVVGDRLFTLDSDDTREYAVARRTTDGREAWRTPIGELFANGFGDGPRSGPTWHEGKLYVLSSLGNLHALAAKDGKVLWSVDLQKQFHAELPRWAFSSAPLVVDDLLVVEAGGTEGRAVVAFERATGNIRWNALDDKIVFSSPIEVELEGVRQLVFLTQKGLNALDTEGKVLWSAPFVPQLDIKPAPPILIPPGLFFVSASYEAGAKAVRVSKTAAGFQAEDIWENPHMRNHFNGSVALGQHLVGFDKATLKCIDAQTGTETWAKRGLGKGSLIRTGDLLLILSERGKLVLAEASTESYKELATHQALTGRSWTQPSLANGRVYVRNAEEIVAFDLRASVSEGAGQ